jgi:hypothetical protein
MTAPGRKNCGRFRQPVFEGLAIELNSGVGGAHGVPIAKAGHPELQSPAVPK